MEFAWPVAPEAEFTIGRPQLLRASFYIIKQHPIVAEKVGGAKLLIVVFETESLCVAQARKALTMPPPLPPESWFCKYITPLPRFQIHFCNNPILTVMNQLPQQSI